MSLTARAGTGTQRYYTYVDIEITLSRPVKDSDISNVLFYTLTVSFILNSKSYVINYSGVPDTLVFMADSGDNSYSTWNTLKNTLTINGNIAYLTHGIYSTTVSSVKNFTVGDSPNAIVEYIPE